MKKLLLFLIFCPLTFAQTPIVHKGGATGVGYYQDSTDVGSIPGSSVVGTAPAQVALDWVNGVPFVTPDYALNYAPASPATLVAGSNTVTFAFCPIGMPGTDTVANDFPHFIRINPAGGDPSPVEWVLITGGTCTLGGTNATLTFSAAFSHTAGYTISSSTSGIQEAIRTYSVGAHTKIELLPRGTYQCDTPIFFENGSSVFEGNYAIIQNASFSSCLVIGESAFLQGPSPFSGESITVDHVVFAPNLTDWSASYSGSIAGGSTTETLTIPTCPVGFWAAIPNQVLWISGTNAGLNTTVWGYGEFALTTGGTCAPGVSNGTIALQNVGFQLTNFSAHGAGGTISNGVGAYLEDNGFLNDRMEDIRIQAHNGEQGNGIQIDTDQAAVISNFNNDTASAGVRCDADFQGAGIFAPGPENLYSAIAYITGSNMANGCYNVNWLSGNDLVLTGNILQDAGAAFVRVGTKRGGFGAFRIRDNHFEGSGNLPWGTEVGVPDISAIGVPSGAPIDATGNIMRPIFVGSNNSAQYPVYTSAVGNTATQYYYLAAHNNSLTAPANCTSGGDCISIPVAIGCANVTDPSINNVPVKFLGWGANTTAPDTGISSYDLLAVSSTQTVCGTLPPAPPSGTGAFAIATGVTPGSICDIHDLCTITDNIAPGSRSSYTVTGYPTTGKSFGPLSMFGEGSVYLGINADTSVGAQGVGAATYIGQWNCLNSVESSGTSGNIGTSLTEGQLPGVNITCGMQTLSPVATETQLMQGTVAPLLGSNGTSLLVPGTTVHDLHFAYGTPGGSALSTGILGYQTVPIGCTITGWNIEVDAGTATVKTLKVAAGTAIPTLGSNSISTSGVSIASGTVKQSTTLSDFTTTSIAANDIVGADLITTSGVGFINFELVLACSQ
jgi:hypothetical protein